MILAPAEAGRSTRSVAYPGQGALVRARYHFDLLLLHRQGQAQSNHISIWYQALSGMDIDGGLFSIDCTLAPWKKHFTSS